MKEDLIKYYVALGYTRRQAEYYAELEMKRIKIL